MNFRDIIQAEAVNKYFDKGIYYLAPRFGKIKTSFLLCEKNNWSNIKIFAPRIDIFEGWKQDQIKFNFEGNLDFCTFTSIKTQEYKNVDLIIIDEIHEASIEQLKGLKKLIGNNKSIGLTGTMTNKTLRLLQNSLDMDVCFKYSIAQAVESGIISDYEIIIHEVSLDNSSKYITTKKGNATEYQRFNQLIWLKNKLDADNKSTFFLDLKVIALLQNSLAKINKTKDLLKQFNHERILVFCGTTESADRLGIPVYHSKSKEKSIFNDFCQGIGKHLATVKMMQAGITILPISKGIINYTSGNPEDSAQKLCRFLGIEYDNLDKKAEIHVIVSKTDFEKERLKTALMFFDENKIKFKK